MNLVSSTNLLKPVSCNSQALVETLKFNARFHKHETFYDSAISSRVAEERNLLPVRANTIRRVLLFCECGAASFLCPVSATDY